MEQLNQLVLSRIVITSISSLLSLSILFFSSNSFSQNMIVNPGFEMNTGMPTGPGQWSKATSWENVNGWIPFQWPYASPDYCHVSGSGNVQLPNTVFGTVNPYDGGAVMGMAVYYPSTFNFREYCATQLSSAMVVGNTYTVSFYATNGTSSMGGMGIGDFGVCLSAGSLTQMDHEPIIATPQYTVGAPFFSTSWQLITFDVVATQAWDYLTIGNFEDDANTTSQTFAGGAALAYYFIDGASVIPATPLPIDLVDFNAVALNNTDVELTWSTSTEINNDFFTVQKTQDGVNWFDVMEVDGAGNSSEILYYEDFDREPYAGLSYYRLKQTDFNGQFKFSDVRPVNIWLDGSSEVLIYPNPAKEMVSIQASPHELSVINVYNKMGQDVTKMITVDINEGNATLNIENLSSGIYTLRTLSTVHKLCKQ